MQMALIIRCTKHHVKEDNTEDEEADGKEVLAGGPDYL